MYNRGHNKNIIFKEDEDYLFFLKRVRQILGLQKSGMSRWMSPLPENSFKILCYCLMPNHFHFLVHQETNIPVSKFLSKLSTSYGAFFNKKYDQVGSVFQDQFKAKTIDDDSYLTYLSVYIHKNPTHPYKWPYSSLLDYAGKKNDSLVDRNLILKMVGGKFSDYQRTFDDYTRENELLISHLTFEN